MTDDSNHYAHGSGTRDTTIPRRGCRRGDPGANIFKDIFASIRDIVGGRSGSYEAELAKAREIAFDELKEQARAAGGNAIVGIDLDYEVVGPNGGMLMVSISGTAVTLG